MNLRTDHSLAAGAVDVPCLLCGTMHRLNTSTIDADGPAFKAYYCRECSAHPVDPGESLQRIGHLLDMLRAGCGESDTGDALDRECDRLFRWINVGGSKPPWALYPSATVYYECRAVDRRRGESVQ